MPSDNPYPFARRFSSKVDRSGLVHLIQLNGINRFSGSIAFQAGSSEGVVFFSEGEVIHADTGTASGEEAFFRIMHWPGAAYTLAPDATPPRRTIQRSLELLLGDCQPAVDGRDEPAAATSPSTASRETAPVAPAPDKLAIVADGIRRLPGVVCAVIDRGGEAGATEARTPLEQQMPCVRRLAQRLGDALRAGRPTAGLVQGTQRNALLLAAKDSYLEILTNSDTRADAVQAEIRSLLASQRT
jgi:hypothetical protein